MKTIYRRTPFIAFITLSFLGAAGCSAAVDGDGSGDVASVEQALCVDDVSGRCSTWCSAGLSDFQTCFEQCVFSHCGELPPPPPPPAPPAPPPPPPPPPPVTYSYGVRCEGSIGNAPRFDENVRGVMSTHLPGTEMPSGTVWSIVDAAVAPCDSMIRQYYRSRCSTLDRSQSISMGVGRTFLAAASGYLFWYDWFVPLRSTEIPVADVCPVRPPPPDRPCNRRPCP